ncbi:rRNA maturation RNase YbeY [Ulvibacterium marinum]|uniref:Endoribonuclease YbeY n=1 Tax=Ulvibacterium marinum TaxID=2419782 RepID=A0A3B0CHE9_9FLAO|nr:rRNA maturation RNase YbeY [Ulvibacterium marinum]RKN82796.1 rRNA maturation RNase YbeY [Ulvibacterium marinum]
MIEFCFETEFELQDKKRYVEWLAQIVASEGREVGNLSFVFCDDTYLLEINQKFLGHDSLTDVITFDYSDDDVLFGDVFISTERLKENSYKFNSKFVDELQRVMAHGVLHLLGYDDKSDDDSKEMRSKEEEKMKLFHVEHQ